MLSAFSLNISNALSQAASPGLSLSVFPFLSSPLLTSLLSSLSFSSSFIFPIFLQLVIYSICNQLKVEEFLPDLISCGNLYFVNFLQFERVNDLNPSMYDKMTLMCSKLNMDKWGFCWDLIRSDSSLCLPLLSNRVTTFVLS